MTACSGRHCTRRGELMMYGSSGAFPGSGFEIWYATTPSVPLPTLADSASQLPQVLRGIADGGGMSFVQSPCQHSACVSIRSRSVLFETVMIVLLLGIDNLLDRVDALAV